MVIIENYKILGRVTGPRRGRGLVLLLLFSALVWFGPLDYRKLVKPDEGRYAEISREMAATGDWITPRLNGLKYFEKPPLQYWATAVAFKVFGVNEWTARLWTAATGFLTVLLIGWGGRRLFGPEAGLYAAMVSMSNVYFAGLGHINTLDMGLTLFTTLAMVGFSLAQRAGISHRERQWAMRAVWAAMALAVLSKGLIGIVLPGATLALYTLATRDWSIWRRLYLLPGLLIFMGLAAPWFVAVSLENPGFAWFFFVHEHFLRYATLSARREGPVYYFVPLLLVGFLPWVVLMLDSLYANAHDYKRQKPLDRPALVLLIWAVLVFVFFSISSSKLPAYILPVFPALALLMGKRLVTLQARQLIARVAPVGVLAVAGFYFIADAVDRAEPASLAAYRQYSYWLYAACAILLAGVVYCCWQSWRGRKWPALTGLTVAGLLFAQLTVTGYQALASTQSAYGLAQTVGPYLEPGIPFYSVKTYDQTLPFYLRRTLTLVDYRDELGFGIDQQPDLAIANMDDFWRRWQSDEKALALMQPDVYKELREAGYPMQIIANDGTRIVVKKPAQ